MSDSFPVTWPEPADATLAWWRERWHNPDPVPPLSGDLNRLLIRGMGRASTARGIPFVVEVRRINTYLYIGSRAARPDDPGSLGHEPQPGRYDRHSTWDRAWLPEIQGYLARWQAFNHASASAPEVLAHIREALAWQERCWEIHASVDFSIAGLIDFCRRELGWDMPAVEKLVAGSQNKSLESDDRVRALADIVRVSPSLREVFKVAGPATLAASIPDDADGRRFRAALRAFLAEFGRRSENTSELAQPSWLEDPAPVLAVIRAYATQPRRDHDAMRARILAEREVSVARARSLLAERPPDVRETFERELAFGQRAAELMETHNYWIDQQALYWARRDFLAAGRVLVQSRVIARADDVFYLFLPEVLAALEGDATPRLAEVASRKAEMTRFAAVEPPIELGTRLPAAAAAQLGLMFGGHERSTAAHEVRGQAASPGSVTGRARLILGIADAGRLEEGDILVTKTTSPPWTPLFGIAAAVVTDAGGALSHCAVVAREYGIPAVVGCVDATAKIPDGAEIRVDGDAGIVTIVSGG